MFNHTSGEFVQIDDARIYYEEAGNKSAAPLLFLHGGFGTLEDFEPIVDRFVREYRLIAIDGRGQGKSTLGSKQLTYRLMMEDAEKVLDHIGIEQTSVVGFSDGGMVAHLMAMANPKKITKLISIGAPWRKEDLHETRDLLARVTLEGWRDRFATSYNLYQSLNPQIDFSALVDNLKCMWLDETDSGGYPDRELERIQCPLLVVRGDDDHLFPRESATLLAGLVKNASLLNIPFAGHEVHKQQAKFVSEIIYEFLRK